MTTLLVLNPLTYSFSHKKVYLNVGDRYVLDNVKDRSELEYILSANFPYPGSFYIHTDPVVEEIIESFKKSVIVEPTSEGVPESSKPERKSDFEALEQEAEESPFLKPEIISVIGQEEKDLNNELDSQAYELSQSESEEIIAQRRATLENMGWRELKTLLEEVYSQKYTNKAEAVEQLLALEFKV